MLREPVDEFFENVMVNAEDKDVRINRLTLLSKLRELFLQVADISAAVSVSVIIKTRLRAGFYT